MKKTPTVTINVGIPASGKSTWTKERIKTDANAVAISRDYFRLMLKDAQVCSKDIEVAISELVLSTAKTMLTSGKDVILDATHLKVDYINPIIEELKYYADINYQVFSIPVEEAILRDMKRQASVGEDVIRRMNKDFIRLMQTFHFQPVKKQKRPSINPVIADDNNAVIFDIDGTLAEMCDRSPFDTERVIDDKLIELVKEQTKFHASRGRAIILCSGRMETAREATVQWLKKHDISYNILLMRKENDFRKDSIIKEEIYNTRIKNKYNVLCVYDDRLQVVDMWFKLGLFVFNVNQGNIQF